MSLNALNSTGLLPSVMADRAFPVVGRNSVDSMRAGVVFGSVLAAEGFIDTFKREFDLPKTTQVVVTGGFADMFMTYFNIKNRLLFLRKVLVFSKNNNPIFDISYILF